MGQLRRIIGSTNLNSRHKSEEQGPYYFYNRRRSPVGWSGRFSYIIYVCICVIRAKPGRA